MKPDMNPAEVIAWLRHKERTHRNSAAVGRSCSTPAEIAKGGSIKCHEDLANDYRIAAEAVERTTRFLDEYPSRDFTALTDDDLRAMIKNGG